MNKLPLANLPATTAPPDSYERRLNAKLHEILNQHRTAINALRSLPQYANNAAALAAGLSVGDLYRSGGDPDAICVVH